MAETRTRSAERASSYISQINSLYAELKTAVRRPDSLTVAVAGPFDPINIPDDINATHAAIAPNPDSVPVKDFERCLKLLTDLSKQRKNDVLEAITLAVNAERDAYVRAKLAEHDEAMHAMMQVRDEEYAARMQARDADAAKMAELLKTLEGQIAHTRSLARPAGLNDGGAADSFRDGIGATGGVVASPQFQADIGVEATISLQFIGGAVNSKDEAKLNALPTEPSPALIASVRDFCLATSLQQKGVRGPCHLRYWLRTARS